MIGPSAMAMPVLAPQSPIALARSPRSVKTLVMIESVVGKMIAAPTPMTARVAISASVLPASAAASVADAVDDQADDEGPPPAEPVAEAAGRQHEGGESQGVRVDDPLELAGGRTEVDDQRRQRDVDQRDVEIDRERAEAEGGEDQRPVLHT